MRGREFTSPILQASYDDIVSVVDLAKSRHVIVTVAGPYTLAHCENMIDCCCAMGIHYCDVSGEIPLTLRVMELHEHAKPGGACICPSSAVARGCPDVLTCLCAKKVLEETGQELVKSITYCRGGGAMEGSSVEP